MGYWIRTFPALSNRTPSEDMYWALSPSTAIDRRPVQPENARSPIAATPFPIVTDCSYVQPENVLSPMDPTPSGRVKDCSYVQPENA